MTIEFNWKWISSNLILCLHQPGRLESEKRILIMIFSIFFSMPTQVGAGLFKSILKNQVLAFISQLAGNLILTSEFRFTESKMLNHEIRDP